MFRKMSVLCLVTFCGLLSGVIIECLAAVGDTLDQTKQSIFSLIDSGDFAKAESATNQLIADFSGNPGLDGVIHLIAGKYQEEKNYQKAIELSRYLITKWPKSWNAVWAQMDIVLSNLQLGNETSAQAETKILMANYGNDPSLPLTLNIVGLTYMRSERYGIAKDIFEEVVEKYPQSPEASKSRFYLRSIEVFSLVDSKDYAAADTALRRLETDFHGNPDLPEMVFWISEKYEWLNRDEGKLLCQQIMKNYPDSPYAEKIKSSITWAVVKYLFMLQDRNGVEKALDKLVVDFARNPDLPGVIMVAGEKHYKEGIAKENNGLPEEARDRFERAVKIWDRVINVLPDSQVPKICCWAGDCYYRMGKYAESIQRFQKVVNNHPDYKYAWYAQFMVGSTYQKMKDKGLLSESDADAMTKTAYQQLISKWPGCDNAGGAQAWLNEHNSK